MKLTRTAGAAAGVVGIAAAAALLLWPAPHAGDSLSPVTLPTATSTTAQSSPMSAAAEEYSREEFGPRWADVDRNGCDTRNDILGRDLVDVVHKPGTNDCVVLTGILHDPFTGETVTFTRVNEGYQPVQIDHIFPLAVAWSSGAASWTTEQRTQFANDPADLQATTANQVKGDSTPSEWLPTGAAACTYATRYLEVTDTYALEISAADLSALDEALTRCPSTR
ncbi:HNH endonuclease family protein [uncultured Microbacterium sp.]|uniref:HNH endonuclease family protein n=1 Tax=uncultured Microbacterium sp. TaxID=191216 RepID=UPI002612FC47|nr:HNH endonuclease family protein [uncultured Microbacterium sp.]